MLSENAFDFEDAICQISGLGITSEPPHEPIVPKQTYKSHPDMQLIILQTPHKTGESINMAIADALPATFGDAKEEVDLETFPTAKALVERCAEFFAEVQDLYVLIT